MNDEDKRRVPPNDDWTATAPSNYELSPNPPPAQSAEEWTMTKPGEKKAPEKPLDKWEMPKPEFRISSGLSPKDFTQSGVNFQLPTHHRQKKQAESTDEGLSKLYAPPERENPDGIAPEQKDVGPDEFAPENSAAQQISAPEAAKSSEPSSAAAAPAFAIEPQPELSEEFPAPAVETEKSPEQESSGGIVRVIFGVLGLLTMLFFAIAFLVLIYFLFFYKAGTE